MKVVGFIGLGTMGLPMAMNILKNGYIVHGYDTNIKRVEMLCERGGVKESSVFDLACKSDVVITMVPSFSQAKEVYDQVFAAAKKGTICIDMSTIEPEKHVDLSKTAESYGLEMLDAPVVKSESAAKDGTLGITGDEKFMAPAGMHLDLDCDGSDADAVSESGGDDFFD